MPERKPISSAPLLVVLAVVLLLFGIYVGGYYWLSRKNVLVDEFSTVTGVVRMYPRKWQVHAFRPAAAVEAALLGVEVVLYDFDTFGDPYAVEP